MSDTYIPTIQALCVDCYQNAKNHGFWEPGVLTNLERLMLIVAEIAEAAEGLRSNDPPDDKIPAFSSMEAELADACIRIFDLAGGNNYRLEQAIWAKMVYNKTRPKLHGKTC